jgi:GT2 family glycosyltransferase
VTTDRALRAAVIVPTYQRPENLMLCLDGITRQTRTADEVIVVVRDTDEPSLAALRERVADGDIGVGGAPTVVTVSQPGVIAALQAGVERSTADLIVLTDDDAVARPDWLATLLSHYADARVACVGGRDVQSDSDAPVDEVGVLQPWGRLVGEQHRGTGEARPVDHLRGVNMSLRRRWWRLDRRLRGDGAQYAWELDACLAARRADRLVIYDPNAIVDHEHAPRFDADQRDAPSFTARAERVHNETYLLLKWLDPWRALIVLAYGLLVGTRSAPGPALLVERVLAGDRDAPVHAAAGLVGRYAAIVTLASAASDREWRRATRR